MVFDVILERFCEQAPFAVMLRASFEHLFAPQRLDELFARCAVDQYTRQLTFSALTELFSEVVLRVRPSVRKAYQSVELPVTLRAVYDKLKGVETATCEALVRQLAADAEGVIAQLGDALRPEPVPGLRLKTVDGNFLAGTEHRLKELRGCGAAALPGMSVVLRDDRTGLLQQALLREDAYTNERALSEQVLAWLSRDDLLLADRNYCTVDLIAALVSKKAFFLFRHHKGLHLQALSRRKRVGKTRTGTVCSYWVRLGKGPLALRCRCIVIELNEPTRDGDTEVVLLTNVSARRAKATTLAELYLRRWRLETSFQELTVLLRCEVDTLAYPKAALFGFALALAAYNVFAVLQAAVAAAHGRAKAEEELSLHAVVEEVKSVKRGMETALPDEVWQRFARMSGAAFAAWLHQAAARLDWRRYQKSKRAPKKPVVVKRTQRGAHRSTARLLAQRKNR
jgi:hypothetical protein